MYDKIDSGSQYDQDQEGKQGVSVIFHGWSFPNGFAKWFRKPDNFSLAKQTLMTCFLASLNLFYYSNLSMIAHIQSCKMKKLLIAGLLLLSAPAHCPVSVSPAVTDAADRAADRVITAVALQPTTQPGSEGNPLILALAPAAQNTTELIQAGQSLAARLQSLTGYHIVLVAPTSEQELLGAVIGRQCPDRSAFRLSPTW